MNYQNDEVSKLADAILRYLAWRQRQQALHDQKAQQRRRRSEQKRRPVGDGDQI